jgi:hypothetical protein
MVADYKGWIGVDLGGTLAEYHGWRGPRGHRDHRYRSRRGGR